ncbi:MAG: hypothetical protein IPF75_06580 [Bacteroidetes bacterium]|nr:hypothetical protein [Bacteroidota bacterium]
MFDATGSNQDRKYSILFLSKSKLYSDFSQERSHSLIYFSFYRCSLKLKYIFWIEEIIWKVQNYSTYMGANFVARNEHLINAILMLIEVIIISLSMFQKFNPVTIEHTLK